MASGNVTQAEATSATTETFVTALVFNVIVFSVEITLFTLLRPRFKAIYEPRTYVPPPAKRIEPIPHSLLAWPLAVYRADYTSICRANGTDAYFFVRYLRLMTIIFLPIWLFTWVLLLPITSVNSAVAGHTGLDKFTYGNVEPSLNARYAAHVIVAYFITGWVCYNLKKEMSHFISKRQEYLTDPAHAQSVQAHTILVTGIPKDHLSQRALTSLFSNLPGGVKKVWINRDLKELPELHDRRLSACNKLESSETDLIRTATKIRQKANKKNPSTALHTADPERSTSLADQLVPRDQRPTHRLPLGFMPFSLPLVGQKVDSIEWAREQIRLCGGLLEKGREIVDRDDSDPEPDEKAEPSGGKAQTAESSRSKTYPKHNSAFVTFHNQIAAHLALQVLSHHDPYKMSGKWGEMSPSDVIWANLSMNPYEQKVRLVISYSITAGLILLWAIPVSFVGIVSNVHALCQKVHFLAWVCKLPAPVVGIISGILPPLMLAVLMMLLPIVLRMLARFQGIPKKTGLELSLMTRFFLFQALHGFLFVTLSAGIIQSLPGIINSPTQTPSLLAQNLPSASTFFLTYMILQGLSGTGAGFLQIVAMVVYYAKLYLLGSTPRSIYQIKYGKRTVEWGTIFPGVTLLVIIALGYSVISPIMNGLACATFFGFYMMYKYLFLWQYQESESDDTGGLFFPKALQHIFVGLYISQICLFALCLLTRNNLTKKQVAIPEAIILFILILLTAFYHWVINNSYDPLINPLPLTLADKCYGSEQATRTEPSGAGAGPAGPQKERDEDIVVVMEEKKAEEKSGTKRMLTDDEYGFAHPALTRPQRVVWMPRDALGLAEAEAEACEAVGVEASSQDAALNEKGKVDIQGPPPDEPENA